MCGPHYCFSRKLVGRATIVFYATAIHEQVLKVLVGSVQEDLGEDPWSWANNIST
jgi:hypothetical protein